jgi:hypothetical protein
MKHTRVRLLIAIAAVGLFSGAANAGAIVFDFGGSVALTCTSSNGSCGVSQSNGGWSYPILDVLIDDLANDEQYPGTFVKLLNHAVQDPYRINFWGDTTYVDVGRGFDSALIVASIKANSGLVDSLYWRPSYRPPGRFELRPVNTPHSIPEPGTYAMFAAALAGLYLMWRRQRRLPAQGDFAPQAGFAAA